MKYLTDFDVENKRVLVRCDFNVPLDDTGNILDDFRIKKTLPTLQYLLSKKARIILMSHLGEAEGKVVEGLRLGPIKKTTDCIGRETNDQVMQLAAGEIILLENLRFHKEEAENNAEFAKELAGLGQVYINDAFSVCHRNHASLSAICQFLPSFAGLLLAEEIKNLTKILENPSRPMLAIIGGAKVKTKVMLIETFSKIADTVIINGLIKKEILQENIHLKHPEKIISQIDPSPSLDISQESINVFKEKIMAAKTIVWNGPFGKFEEKKYETGTLEIAKAIIKSQAFSVVGGGETIEFLHKEGILSQFSHVSLGGGAMLSFLAGEQLPGLVALG